MKKQFSVFVVRWMFNSLGLWVAVRLFGEYHSTTISTILIGFLFAGLVFSLVNSVLKPFFVILSLPAILLTVGLFMLVVNGLMVYISLKLTPGISMTFFESILAGILMSLVNYIVSATMIVKSGRVNKGI